MNSEAPSIILYGTELGDFPDTYEGRGALKLAAEAAWKKLIGLKVLCPALGAEVELRGNRQTPAKFFYKNFNARKLKTVPIVEQLIRNGVKFKPSEKPYNAPDTTTHFYHYLRTEFELAGEALAARIVIREDKEGHFHYDHTVENASIVFDLPKTKGLPK